MAKQSRLTDRKPSRNRGLTRRQALGTVGLSLAGLATLGTASADEYEVIEASGQTIHIEDGETFENALIDLTTGQGITIYARDATDWTIRNVGFRGRYQAGGFMLAVSDGAGGESTVENVYLGDGCDMSGEGFVHGPGAIFQGPEHAGHIEFTNLNIQEYTNNAFYCSNGSGTVHIDGCYAADNGVTNYRVNSDGDRITNSVAHATGDVPDGNYHGRGIWGWNPGTIEVEACAIDMAGTMPDIAAGANHQPSQIVVDDSALPDDADIDEANGGTIELAETDADIPLEPPEDCPTDAEEAASGD